MKVEDFADNPPEFKIEDYFQGETWAWGVFEDRFGHLKRSFKVTMTGTVTNNQLVLDEDFIYDDGSVDKRIWKIDILDDNRYSGTADDVVGLFSERSSEILKKIIVIFVRLYIIFCFAPVQPITR